MVLRILRGLNRTFKLACKTVRDWFRVLEKPVALAVVLVFVFSIAPLVSADVSEPTVYVNNKLMLIKGQIAPVEYSSPDVTMAIVESRYDENQRRLTQEAVKKLKNREVVSRSASHRVEVLAEPDLVVKRALAKRAAETAGISDYWSIVEAVWQIESGKKWQTSVRSSAGAQGPMQFMRATWERNKVDGNGDGVYDITNAEDAVMAGAQLLANAGLANDNIDQALLAYNHAAWYVQKVKKIAGSIVE